MDAYLDSSYGTSRGVADLIRWYTEHEILFMIKGSCTTAPGRFSPY